MEDHAVHEMEMTGALGRYPMAREASGTAWQPDSSKHGGLHLMTGRMDLDGPWQAGPGPQLAGAAARR